MKILSVSDYVVSTLYDNFDAECFPNIDLILSCGDLPPEHLSYLVASFNAPLYYVRGNHDIRYDSKPPDGCLDLNARLIQFQGIKIRVTMVQWRTPPVYRKRDVEDNPRFST